MEKQGCWRAGSQNGQASTRHAIHHAIACFSPSRVHRATGQFILSDPRTDKLFIYHPLLFTPTKYTTGLCLLVRHQALYVPIATINRHLAPHPVNNLCSIHSSPTRVCLMFPARSSSSHGVSRSRSLKSGLLDTFVHWRAMSSDGWSRG
jgi:hypothetical protein